MSDAKKILLAVGIGSLAIVTGLALARLSREFLIVFAAILAAVSLHSLVELLRERVSMNRRIALALVLAGMLVLGLSFFAVLGARVYSQFDELGVRLPVALDRLQSWLTESRWLSPIGEEFSDLRMRGLGSDSINRGSESASGGMLRFFQSTFGTLSSGLIWLVLSIYLLIEPDTYTRGILALVPRRYHPVAKDLLTSWKSALSWWVLGRLSSMAIVGVLTTVGLLALGVSLPLALGALAGMLSFVPFLGPLVATIPATLMALLESPALAGWVLALFALIQLLESYVITPQIERETVSVPPALMIAAQVLAGVLLGLWGVALATPLLVSLVVLVQIVYIREYLGRETEVWGNSPS